MHFQTVCSGEGRIANFTDIPEGRMLESVGLESAIGLESLVAIGAYQMVC